MYVSTCNPPKYIESGMVACRGMSIALWSPLHAQKQHLFIVDTFGTQLAVLSLVQR